MRSREMEQQDSVEVLTLHRELLLKLLVIVDATIGILQTWKQSVQKTIKIKQQEVFC